MTKETSKVYYSNQVPGDKGNYKMPARYDFNGGYLGITQTKTDGQIERVLLSPRQVTELIQFCATHRPARAKR